MTTTTTVTEENVFPNVCQKGKEFVTVVAVDPVEQIKKKPFVTILSIGDNKNTWKNVSEEVLVYRLPGERLGFGLKFDGGANAVEKVTKLIIQSCAPDSPASRTTVSWGHFSPGDEILEIDNIPVTTMTRMECVRSLKESNVQLKLKVKKGDENDDSNSNASKQIKNLTPPPVPPRKYPRRNSKNGTNCTTPTLCSFETINNESNKSVNANHTLKVHEKVCLPEPQVYIDLIGQENINLGNYESKSNDNGNSMSTVVNKHLSASTTSNSSFSDIRSVNSSDVEPMSLDNIRQSRKYDLNKVLEPFLQLEREFSSCATIKDNNDLFQKLIAAASLEEDLIVENSDTFTILKSPSIFHDIQSYQKAKDDFNNNELKLKKISAKNNLIENNGESMEEPPRPLPRREIPSRSLIKYGKKKPPPPPPSTLSSSSLLLLSSSLLSSSSSLSLSPLQIKEKLKKYPIENNQNAEFYDTDDLNISKDRLPRLIDFVPKDRTDATTPNATLPNPMDLLLEHQRITSIVNQNTCIKGSIEFALTKNRYNREARLINEKIESLMFQKESIHNDYNSSNPEKFLNSADKRKINDDQIDTMPNKTSTHAEPIDITQSNKEDIDNDLLTIVSPVESNKIYSVNLPSSEEVKLSSLSSNYFPVPISDEIKKMKPLLTLSSSVNSNLSNSPPAYSRMPPDGHEFPQTYQEINHNTGVYDLNSPIAATKSIAYQDTCLTKKTSTYTDILNEAKFLDIERKCSNAMHTKTSNKTYLQQHDSSVKRHSQSWRNDERSERSVKDKIAMFSNAISKANSVFPRPVGRYHEETAHHHSSSRVFSKSVFAVNAVDNGMRLKSKDSSSYCQQEVVESTNPSININRTQSSIDLTLFSSSCSSAYSSCSPDSSLSPMSSPSYTIGSSSTLPRKHRTHVLNSGSDSGYCSTYDKKHTALSRTTSFTGPTSNALHSRSQSLIDVLHVPTNRFGEEHRKDSLSTLIEQRRRTMSKLRGLVIPEKSSGEIALKPIVDLPEIKSKEVLLTSGSTLNNLSLPKISKIETSTNYINCSWKSVLNSADIPKYSPAFKRKTLTIYGVSSSASSLSSSLNSSREELRENVKKSPPVKPPRTCNIQLVYGPVSTSINNKQLSSNESLIPKDNKINDYKISRMEISKLHEDSDNDSAVSSSRSSLCQEYSPPSSPLPNITEFDNLGSDRISNGSPSQSSSKTLRRTLSSETNVSLMSTVSTLTSASQASCSSNGDTCKESSKRILKAESVEAINRKNVLSSAKYSCGQDFKVGSPLIKDVYEGESRFNEEFDDVCNEEQEWFEYKKYDKETFPGAIKIAYLEIQDSEESDSSVNESSSIDTDEALDKSLDSTDSICGNYKSEITIEKCFTSVSKETNTDTASDKKYTHFTTINESNNLKRNKSDFIDEDINNDKNLINDLNEETKKPINDIKKVFEKCEQVVVKKIAQLQNHLRTSSTDSTTSEESFPVTVTQGLHTNLLREQQFGSITSIASSTSLISQQELQQLIDDANQTLEETAGSGEHDLMVIILHRDTVTSSIGITLAGGADYEAKEITVHKVLIGSPADKDGRIQKGDRILSINGRNMKGVTHREALSILKAPRSEVVLVVSRWKADGLGLNTMIKDSLVATFKNTIRPPRIPELTQQICDIENLNRTTSNNADKITKGLIISVSLVKEGGSLGFSLEGGKDSPFGDRPLTIKKIFTGGCAAKTGVLKAGDELISLNGVDVTVMSRTEAWNVMKRLSDGQVIISIRRPLKEIT